MNLKRFIARAALVLTLAPPAGVSAANTGLIPLIDLGSGSYRGFPGGLYPGSANVPPYAHEAGALAAAAQVQPRNAVGAPEF